MSFQPGQSGNPQGRPKKRQSLTEALCLSGEEILQGSTKTRKEALCERLWTLALQGDVAAIKYVFDRIDGKPNNASPLTDIEGGLRIILTDTKELDMSNVELFLGTKS